MITLASSTLPRGVLVSGTAAGVPVVIEITGFGGWTITNITSEAAEKSVPFELVVVADEIPDLEQYFWYHPAYRAAVIKMDQDANYEFGPGTFTTGLQWKKPNPLTFADKCYIALEPLNPRGVVMASIWIEAISS